MITESSSPDDEEQNPAYRPTRPFPHGITVCTAFVPHAATVGPYWPLSTPQAARWGLHSYAAGRTWWTPNQHAPWPLHAAEVLHLDEDLVHRAGFKTQAEAMLRPLFSPGVYTTFGFPHAP